MSHLLEKFGQDVARAGLVGEEINAKLVLLTAISAQLGDPLNTTVCGSSAAGKNHLAGTVARFIPDVHKKMLTGMSPKALMHAGENEFQHKAVFIAEYEGVSGADYSIRTMQSEREIRWDFAESSKDGIKKKSKKVKGPAAFIQATTRVALHPENETRLLFLQIDESPEQTIRINLRQAQEAAGKIEPCPNSTFEEWHEVLRGLKDNRMVIPFAEQLAASMPADRIRSRRDFPKLLGLIECSAYLHQNERARNQHGFIVAQPGDYQVARALMRGCIDTTLEKSSREFLQALSDEGELFQFTVRVAMQKTGWKKTKTYEVITRLEELGWVGPGDQRGFYTLLRTQPEAAVALPEKIRLTAEDFRISAQRPSS